MTERIVALRREFRNLRDQAQARVFADGYFPVVRFHAAVKNLQQSGLARAVRADQSDSFAGGYRERDILEQRSGPVSLR